MSFIWSLMDVDSMLLEQRGQNALRFGALSRERRHDFGATRLRNGVPWRDKKMRGVQPFLDLSEQMHGVKAADAPESAGKRAKIADTTAAFREMARTNLSNGVPIHSQRIEPR